MFVYVVVVGSVSLWPILSLSAHHSLTNATWTLSVEWADGQALLDREPAASKDVVHSSLIHPLKMVGALPVNSTFLSRLLGNVCLKKKASCHYRSVGYHLWSVQFWGGGVPRDWNAWANQLIMISYS